MKIFIEVEIPESGMTAYREAVPPPPGWDEEQVRHAIIRALIMGICHDIGARGFEFDQEVPGSKFGGGYVVRQMQ